MPKIKHYKEKKLPPPTGAPPKSYPMYRNSDEEAVISSFQPKITNFNFGDLSKQSKPQSRRLNDPTKIAVKEKPEQNKDYGLQTQSQRFLGNPNQPQFYDIKNPNLSNKKDEENGS